jgi:cadmium resistance protein CadD (predicted permease)
MKRKSVEQTKEIMAYIALAIAFFTFLGLFFVDIPEKNRDMVNIMLGAVMGWGTTVFGFYFGNAEKNKTEEVKDNEPK